jgi:murein DD-endopeptidase MepM/ murein hydrolase activator NlpD
VIKLSPRAALAAFFMVLGLGAQSPALAQPAETSEATVAEERLLGSGDEEQRAQALLPFTRTYGVSGTVSGSLARSAAGAGVPPAAMLEARRAWNAAVDAPKPRDGDSFYVSWEQTFAVDGDPIGVGKVKWMELRTPAGATASIHRFRPHEGGEQFFLASGQAALPPAIALPVETVTVSSPFGLRTNPFASRAAMGPVPPSLPFPSGSPQRMHSPGGARIAAMMAAHQARRMYGGFGPRLFGPQQVFMHEGVDLAVPVGTPVYAARDGVVAMAEPHAGYGNYVRIDHGDGLATAYGHLSRFAPGLKPGTKVVRGELVAFSGSTGRSTGPHLHFEVLTGGKPVDPLTHAAVAQLGGMDLQHFDRLVADRERARDWEREHENAAAF